MNTQATSSPSKNELRKLGDALLALELNGDCLTTAADGADACLDWGQPNQRAIGKMMPEALATHDFSTGSMGLMVEADCTFVFATGKRAAIGSLAHIEEMLVRSAGTQVRLASAGSADTL